MRIEEQRELLATRGDVWNLLAEPHHLSDWWPGYTTIRPDRRGLAEGARWQIVRGSAPGLLRRPGGEGLIVVTAVEPARPRSARACGGGGQSAGLCGPSPAARSPVCMPCVRQQPGSSAGAGHRPP